MKKFSNLATILVLLCVILAVGAFEAQAQTTILNKYLVLFNAEGVPADFTGIVQALGGRVVYTHNIGVAVVEGLTSEASAKLAKSKAVMQIQKDISIQLDDPIVKDNRITIEGMDPSSPDNPATAAFYPFQWNMPAVNAPAAWAAGRLGSPAMTLAILDTGIDYEYLDLIGRVDLSRSASFVPEDDALVDANFPGKNYITDLYTHGTMVSSIAASNSNVIAGVTTQTTLMGVKVCGVYSACPMDSIIAGLLHAIDNGADVANMSLGGGFLKQAAGQYVGFFNRIFNYASRIGMTVVVSAGNEAIDLDHDGNLYKTFCSTPSTICVSATGPASSDNIYVGPWYDIDAFASYSNYGRSSINVAAPGGNDGGFVWGACSGTSLVLPFCQSGIWVVGGTGTSFSAPHVSALAILLVEQYGRRPGFIRSLIQQSADDLGQPGTDPYYGKGRINIGTAIK